MGLDMEGVRAAFSEIEKDHQQTAAFRRVVDLYRELPEGFVFIDYMTGMTSVLLSQDDRVGFTFDPNEPDVIYWDGVAFPKDDLYALFAVLFHMFRYMRSNLKTPSVLLEKDERI